MTIVKECTICKVGFTTRTFKSATWERYCPKCYAEKRSTRAVEKMQKHNDNDMVELRDRVRNVEAHLDNIPAITHAEINNQLLNLSDLDQFDLIKQGLTNTINQEMLEVGTQMKESIEALHKKQEKFEEKIQKQLMTLNNKLIRLLQEMD